METVTNMPTIFLDILQIWSLCQRACKDINSTSRQITVRKMLCVNAFLNSGKNTIIERALSERISDSEMQGVISFAEPLSRINPPYLSCRIVHPHTKVDTKK